MADVDQGELERLAPAPGSVLPLDGAGSDDTLCVNLQSDGTAMRRGCEAANHPAGECAACHRLTVRGAAVPGGRCRDLTARFLIEFLARARPPSGRPPLSRAYAPTRDDPPPGIARIPSPSDWGKARLLAGLAPTLTPEPRRRGTGGSALGRHPANARWSRSDRVLSIP
jgi:hypothetical protein